jgi:hypothetical protein
MNAAEERSLDLVALIVLRALERAKGGDAR